MNTLHTLSTALDLACLAVCVAGALAWLLSRMFLGTYSVAFQRDEGRTEAASELRIGLPVHLVACYMARVALSTTVAAPKCDNVTRSYDRNVIPPAPIRSGIYARADGMAAALGPRWLTD